MNCTTEIFGDVVVVHAPEELASDAATAFERFALNLEQVNVIIDLDATESLDSAGLTALTHVQDELHRAHGELRIITTNQVNQKILEITRLNQRIEVFDSVIDAVKSFL